MLSDYGVNYTLGELASAFLDESDYKSAIAVYDRAIQSTTHSDQSYFRYLRGMAYLQWGQTEKATAEFTALVQDQNTPYAYAGLAEVAADQGRYGEAVKLFNRAYESNTADYVIRMQRGAMFARMGDYEKAMEDDSAIASDFPQYFYPFTNRCWDRAISDRDLDAALSDCNHSLDILPDYPDTLESRALVRFRQGRWDDAIADENSALSHNPRSASAYFMRGVVEIRKGDAAAGNADVQRAEIIYPRIGQQFAVYGISP